MKFINRESQIYTVIVSIYFFSFPVEPSVVWCRYERIKLHSVHLLCFVGFVIYFGYGIRNSVEGNPKQDTNDNEFILQATPDYEQDVQAVQPSHGATAAKEPLEASFSEPTS